MAFENSGWVALAVTTLRGARIIRSFVSRAFGPKNMYGTERSTFLARKTRRNCCKGNQLLTMFIEWDTEREESFNFLGITLDVRAVRRFLKAHPHESKELQVQRYGALLDMIAGLSSAGPVDLSVPVICIAVGKGSFPIDGWNRISKAFNEGLEIFPCVRILEKDLRRIAEG